MILELNTIVIYLQIIVLKYIDYCLQMYIIKFRVYLHLYFAFVNYKCYICKIIKGLFL